MAWLAASDERDEKEADLDGEEVVEEVGDEGREEGDDGMEKDVGCGVEDAPVGVVGDVGAVETGG